MAPFCQIEYVSYSSDDGMPCRKPALTKCADCGASICSDCRSWCCGDSFCEILRTLLRLPWDAFVRKEVLVSASEDSADTHISARVAQCTVTRLRMNKGSLHAAKARQNCPRIYLSERYWTISGPCAGPNQRSFSRHLEFQGERDRRVLDQL